MVHAPSFDSGRWSFPRISREISMNNEQEMRAAFEAFCVNKDYGKETDWGINTGTYLLSFFRESFAVFQAGAEWQQGQMALDKAPPELNPPPAPDWSLEIPNESGFYWCRWPDDGPNEWQEPQVEELDVQDGIVYLCSIGTDVERYTCALWWPIPITPPTGGRP